MGQHLVVAIWPTTQIKTTPGATARRSIAALMSAMGVAWAKFEAG